MDSQSQEEINNLIEFAFAERKYKNVIELTETFIALFGGSQKIYEDRAKAFMHLQKFKQALDSIEISQKQGNYIQELIIMKIQCLLELKATQEAQAAFNNLVKANKNYQKILNFKNALQIMKDSQGKYRITQEEEKLLETMKQWLYPVGAKYDKLKIVNLYDDYRGVITTSFIKKKEPIVYIPKSEIITLQMAKNNRFCKELIKSQVKLLSPKHTYISIFLLQERSNPKSKWRTYIDLLPKDHSSFPINYSKEQLELLIGSPFLFMISEKVKDLKRDYDMVINNRPQFQQYSFKDFCWARMMVGSRIFGLMISGVKTEVLVPFADMLNHKTPKQTVWNYIQPLNGFVIQSLEDIDIGQQVFDSYGRKCNSRFLLNYGFIIDQNADNQISLRISIEDKDPFNKIKLSMIKQLQSEGYSVIQKVGLNMNNNKFYELMGCLRFIVIDELESLKILQKISNILVTKQAYKMVRTPPLSLQNQIACWSKFMELCKTSLSNYTETIEEDRKLLKKPKISQNFRNIINLRMGEKYILTQFIEVSTQIITILESQAMIDILEKQNDKIYYKYLCKMLSVMPGINKQALNKKIGSGINSSTQQQITGLEDGDQQEVEDTENN